jgi:3-oxoacyl-[acyl-carrier-protein] synthase-3
MLHGGGHQRILLLNGDTPTLFTDPADHATTLLFGDAGSATALESAPGADGGWFCLQTDGQGYEGLIIRGGGFRDRTPINPRDLYLSMDGAGVFNFTLKRVPALIRDTLAFAKLEQENIDWFLFHQSNQFIMKHLVKKCGLPLERVPFVLDRYGNTGGPSVALALTQGVPVDKRGAARLMLVGYGVGLSWGSAIVNVDAATVLLHSDYSADSPRL